MPSLEFLGEIGPRNVSDIDTGKEKRVMVRKGNKEFLEKQYVCVATQT